MCEACPGHRKDCYVCDSSERQEGHFLVGAIVICLACWREIENRRRKPSLSGTPPLRPKGGAAYVRRFGANLPADIAIAS